MDERERTDEPVRPLEGDPHAVAPSARTERIPLQRAVAVVAPGSVGVRPSRAGLASPALEAASTALAVWAIATLMDRLSLWVLMVLLLFVIVAGPAAVLGLVYHVAGSSFLMERAKRTARWQQGFLGLGLGTRELVPFERIQRIEVVGDYGAELESGDLQDVVRWEVRLVKDNDRAIEVGAISAARTLADEALNRANALASALGEMSGTPVRLGALPAWALLPDDEEDDVGG